MARRLRSHPEVGDFHRMGEDFYCTIDRSLMNSGNDLLYLEAAYKIARVQVALAALKEGSGARRQPKAQKAKGEERGATGSLRLALSYVKEASEERKTRNIDNPGPGAAERGRDA